MNKEPIKIGKRFALSEKTNKTKIEDLKTWEQICNYIKRDPNLLPSFLEIDEIDRKHHIADIKLTICARVRNEGWVPDYNNPNQKKWYNWFKYDASRGCFVFHGAYTSYEYTGTGVGARFCFPTEGRAKTFAVDFADLYNDLFILKN